MLIFFFFFFFFWNLVLYPACVPKTQKRSPSGITVYLIRVGRACAAVWAGIAMLSKCVMAIGCGGRVCSMRRSGLNRGLVVSGPLPQF